MSRRTSDASKAIRKAWDKERLLVLKGKGTRDWTPDQQQAIIERGIAFDNEGRAFEGQHMKSVEAYPEYQGDPNNIQLLTRQEHLDAHRGNWQNPTNWYYDPITKEITDLGDGLYSPPEIIELSDPVFTIEQPEETSLDETDLSKTELDLAKDKEDKAPKQTGPAKNAVPSGFPDIVNKRKLPKRKSNWLLSVGQGIKKYAIKGGKIAFKVGKYLYENPDVLIEGLTVLGSIIGTVETAKSNSSRSSSHREDFCDSGEIPDDDHAIESDWDPFEGISEDSGFSEEYSDSECEEGTPEKRSSPIEHEVKGHPQRYGKNKEWKEKAPYRRGGKNGE